MTALVRSLKNETKQVRALIIRVDPTISEGVR